METVKSGIAIGVKRWDRAYEWKAITLLSLGFGLLGLDRWIIVPLFPFIMKDLKLGYQDLGNLVAVLGICWGASSVILGAASDMIGRRKILIPAIVGFSLLSSFSGIAAGFASLLIIRALMGLLEGAFCPSSVAATADASAPERRGLNQGLQLSAFALFGLGFGPVIATQLLRFVPTWRWVFMIVAIPGLIIAAFLGAVIREPVHLKKRSENADNRQKWRTVFGKRNVIVAMFALMCAMTGVFVLSAMMPNYLIDYLHLTPEQMGFVMSAIGFGGFFDEFIVAGISDILGRKITGTISFGVAAVLLFVFTKTDAHPATLFLLLFVITFFCFGLLALLTGPIATEAVPVGLISSAVGIVSGIGEIFGGGVAPSVAGFIAEHYGINHTLYLALFGLTAGMLGCLSLKETAPRKTT